ncbi:2-keto-4-pentenoate hydratase/2-oxohepta-3-ene-1,7-dioic acid hydratase in catechol pathway [Neorhizobium galegae]|uniref:fumarylacetoacetate hydrolase family protein n=1 Tax=Neorhizobium galegae TaxID=399 RepID=UPI001AEA72E3|nr:fumarylacetoacetate hydrolase family protein [Neorhizobium galegae]MBP2551113.1 2-keto-4-pentenoate hydratase/2-oxohepta-3-ene-1,7-dioic acid hydratase in catechol pathway [Neorhizobium galegae]
MKLVRYGEIGAEQPGILDKDGRIRSLSGHLSEIDGNALQPDALARLAAIDLAELPLAPENPRLGPPLARPGKLIGIGLNYSDHAAESNLPIPKEPIVFMKATSAIAGPYDAVVLPADAIKPDWEVELAFVIGRKAKRVTEAEALSHVAGYLICNDISDRHWQAEREGQWTKGKSHDGFAPLGPWLVTADEIADPGQLAMTLDVSGVRRQNGSTRTMIFGVAYLVSYLSQFMTLEPGDVVTTGTPPGVGLGMRPQVWLKHGDVMRLEIEGLGHQEQHVRVEGR